MPYFVKIDGSYCIQTRASTAAYPKVFELSSENGFSQITKQYRNNGEISEGTIPDDLMDCTKISCLCIPGGNITLEEKQL